MIRREAYFICKEHRVVEKLNPHAIVEEPLLLSSDALIHILHRKADAMAEVIEGFLNIDYTPLGIGHQIEACISSTVSFFARILHDAPFSDFGWSTTTFFRPLPFLQLILSELFPLSCRGGGEGWEDWQSADLCFTYAGH